MSASRYLTVAEAKAEVEKLVICPICETTHSPDEVELLESGVDDDVTWKDYKCLKTGETWTHLSHAAIPDVEPVPAPEVTG